MNYKINVLYEFFLTGIYFATLWLLLNKLHYQESKVKRILLIICMLLFRPIHILISPFLSLPDIIRILLHAAAFLSLIIFAGGKKRYVCITVIYLWIFHTIVDTIASWIYIGITGDYPYSVYDIYLLTSIPCIVTFLWAVFYYYVMRAIPQEAIDRIPLRFWLILILTPFLIFSVLFSVLESIHIQLEAGYNNFLYLGVFNILLLVLNLFIFYFFIKLAVSYNAALLASELNKTPPVYTPQNGLSPEFTEKYGLSKRQAEIAEAIIQGKSNKEIAILFDIEVNTVQVHLQNVYRKTGAPGRYALMALVGLGK